MASTNADCLDSTATSALIRTSADGATDGTLAALSSPTVPSSADGASKSIVRDDNAKTGSRIVSNGMLDSLTSTDGVVT